jgi:hypothetical protein
VATYRNRKTKNDEGGRKGEAALKFPLSGRFPWHRRRLLVFVFVPFLSFCLVIVQYTCSPLSTRRTGSFVSALVLLWSSRHTLFCLVQNASINNRPQVSLASARDNLQSYRDPRQTRRGGFHLRSALRGDSKRLAERGLNFPEKRAWYTQRLPLDKVGLEIFEDYFENKKATLAILSLHFSSSKCFVDLSPWIELCRFGETLL